MTTRAQHVTDLWTRTGIPHNLIQGAPPPGTGYTPKIATCADTSIVIGVVKMINTTENKIISRVLDMLNDIDPLLLETNSNIEVKWKNDNGYVIVDFTNEYDQWIYEVNVE